MSSKPTRAHRWVLSIVFGVLLPAAVYLTVHNMWMASDQPANPLEALGVDVAALDPDTLAPRRAWELGLKSPLPATEVVAVVISSSFCSGNQIEGFRDAVAKIPSLLRERTAGFANLVPHTVGISVDQRARVGTQYLQELADFDEISSGGGWTNSNAAKYFWESYSLPAGVPQVVLLSRRVTRAPADILIEDETILETITSAEGIVEWVRNGGPTTDLSILNSPDSSPRPPHQR